jgi:hypothetical protein
VAGNLARLGQIRLDGRDGTRFSETHPITYQYIRANFRRVALPDAESRKYEIYVADDDLKPASGND